MKRIPAQPSSSTAALGAARSRTAKSHRSDRGAAALEFALVVPVLLILVLGIMEFGRAYNIQSTLSGAAREGARVMALKSSASDAKAAVIAAAAPAVTLSAGQISVTPSSCVVTGAPDTAPVAIVTVTYPMSFVTNLFGSPSVTLKGRGVMRCNG